MQLPLYTIAQVTDQLEIGGAEQVIVMLANLQQAHGHRVTVVTTVAPGPLAGGLRMGIQLVNLNRRNKWNFVAMYRLSKLLREIDVVHVHALHTLRYVSLAAAIFRLRKKIVYHEHHGNRVQQPASGLTRWLLRRTVFIGASQSLCNWAVAAAGLVPGQVCLLRNTVIKEKSNGLVPADDAIRLCMVGNVLPNKNVLFALQLLQQLSSSGVKPVYLTIYGNIRNNHYYQQLIDYIQAHRLSGHVNFVTGCSRVQPVLSQYHLALHCSLSESGPLVLVEYLAQGLPFISFATGEVAAQLQHVLPEMFMQQFDVHAWAIACKELLDKPRSPLTQHLQQLYAEAFSPELYYQQCSSIYKQFF